MHVAKAISSIFYTTYTLPHRTKPVGESDKKCDRTWSHADRCIQVFRATGCIMVVALGWRVRLGAAVVNVHGCRRGG